MSRTYNYHKDVIYFHEAEDATPVSVCVRKRSGARLQSQLPQLLSASYVFLTKHKIIILVDLLSKV